MARRAPLASRTHHTRGLVLRRVPYGESDLILLMLTESMGAVSALARGARTGQHRRIGTVEPMHTLRVRLQERAHNELLTLREAAIDTPRCHLISALDRMEAAGRALGWVRRATPPQTPEPALWSILSGLLDRLNDARAPGSPARHLAASGLQLLAALGWGIDFERCVVSGAACAPGRSAMVDAARGGLVSQACGGARVLLSGAARERLRLAAAGHNDVLLEEDAGTALGLVEEALTAQLRA